MLADTQPGIRLANSAAPRQAIDQRLLMRRFDSEYIDLRNKILIHLNNSHILSFTG
jgi:hypothetical protein